VNRARQVGVGVAVAVGGCIHATHATHIFIRSTDFRAIETPGYSNCAARCDKTRCSGGVPYTPPQHTWGGGCLVLGRGAVI
jgi:hypothetical protein